MKNLLVFSALAMLVAPAASAADTYNVDSAHAAAMFKVGHLGIGYTWGTFNDLSGSYTLDKKNPANSSINITIKTASVDTNNQKRDDHLRGPDFFNAKQFPTLTFESTKVEKAKGDDLKVTGKLTMHGVTKTITVPVKKVGEGKDPWGNYRTGYEAMFVVNRHDYGITFMKGVAGDDITVHLALEGVKK